MSRYWRALFVQLPTIKSEEPWFPYLKAATRRAKRDLVFPGHDGEMLSQNAQLEKMLRCALGRARIVEHYSHVCRKKGCSHQGAADDGKRRCPEHGYRLWPKARVRKVRFHGPSDASTACGGGGSKPDIEEWGVHGECSIGPGRALQEVFRAVGGNARVRSSKQS